MNKNSEIKDAIKERLISIIRKPQAAQKNTKPKNYAPFALVGFNLTMTFLDFVSALTVGWLVSWMYGVMTFIAGVAALLLWERLFTNAHANFYQKILAVCGGILAIFSTLGIGILSALANVLNVAAWVSVSSIETGMIVALVVTVFIHGSAWGVYYFADPSHVAEMKRTMSIAYREQQKQGLADAKSDVISAKEIMAELDDAEQQGDLEALAASYEELRGHSLLNTAPVSSAPAVPAPIPAPAPFVRNQQVTPPLSELGDEDK